eukprot:1774551-Prymnesium_polylepis.1
MDCSGSAAAEAAAADAALADAQVHLQTLESNRVDSAIHEDSLLQLLELAMVHSNRVAAAAAEHPPPPEIDEELKQQALAVVLALQQGASDFARACHAFELLEARSEGLKALQSAACVSKLVRALCADLGAADTAWLLASVARIVRGCGHARAAACEAGAPKE